MFSLAMLTNLVFILEEIHDEKGDAEAYYLSKIIYTYNFVACLHMMNDVLHTIAKH